MAQATRVPRRSRHPPRRPRRPCRGRPRPRGTRTHRGTSRPPSSRTVTCRRPRRTATSSSGRRTRRRPRPSRATTCRRARCTSSCSRRPTAASTPPASHATPAPSARWIPPTPRRSSCPRAGRRPGRGRSRCSSRASTLSGTAAPFIVVADGPNPLLFATLETLIARKRIPVMIGIAVGNGGGDAQGSERGLEYDTLSPRYAEFIEKDVLPQVERRAGVRLTSDPDQRATMGCSSGAAAAFTMAWYRNDLYHRVLSYSGTYVNQQWPSDPETPGGAWEYHRRLVPEQPPQAHPHLDARGRSRPAEPQRHARRHARLGGGERADGEGARREGLRLPVRLRPQRRPLRSRRHGPDPAGRARVAVASRRRSSEAILSRRGRARAGRS